MRDGTIADTYQVGQSSAASSQLTLPGDGVFCSIVRAILYMRHQSQKDNTADKFGSTLWRSSYRCPVYRLAQNLYRRQNHVAPTRSRRLSAYHRDLRVHSVRSPRSRYWSIRIEFARDHRQSNCRRCVHGSIVPMDLVAVNKTSLLCASSPRQSVHRPCPRRKHDVSTAGSEDHIPN